MFQTETVDSRSECGLNSVTDCDGKWEINNWRALVGNALRLMHGAACAPDHCVS